MNFAVFVCDYACVRARLWAWVIDSLAFTTSAAIELGAERKKKRIHLRIQSWHNVQWETKYFFIRY